MKEYIDYATRIISERCSQMEVIKSSTPAHLVQENDILELVKELKEYPFDRSNPEIKKYRQHTYLLINNWRARMIERYMDTPDRKMRAYFMPDIEFCQLLTTIEKTSEKHFPSKKVKR